MTEKKKIPILHKGKNVGEASCVEITTYGATGRLELDPIIGYEKSTLPDS